MVVHHLVNFVPTRISFIAMCNKRIVSGKNFKAIQSVVYLVGITIKIMNVY